MFEPKLSPCLSSPRCRSWSPLSAGDFSISYLRFDDFDGLRAIVNIDNIIITTIVIASNTMTIMIITLIITDYY